jgi:phosphoserine phosphatase
MSLGRLHDAGHKRDAITKALASIPMASGSIESLSSLSQAGAICTIISDANTIFIDEILKAYKCRHYFTDANIHTNPVSCSLCF